MEQIIECDDHVELVRLWAFQAGKAQVRIDELTKRLKNMDNLCRVQSAGLMSMARQRNELQEEIEAEEEKRAVADERMLEFIRDAIKHGQQQV